MHLSLASGRSSSAAETFDLDSQWVVYSLSFPLQQVWLVSHTVAPPHRHQRQYLPHTLAEHASNSKFWSQEMLENANHPLASAIMFSYASCRT